LWETKVEGREGLARRRRLSPTRPCCSRDINVSPYAGVLNVDFGRNGETQLILHLPLLYESDFRIAANSRHVGYAGISNASPKPTTRVKCNMTV
jgi:hypothetical protein